MADGAWVVALLVILAMLLDLFDRFWAHLQTDVDEGEIFPDRWLAWGNVRSLGSPNQPPVRRYFLLRFPSYTVLAHPCWDNEPRWVQNILGRSWTIAPNEKHRQHVIWHHFADPIRATSTITTG